MGVEGWNHQRAPKGFLYRSKRWENAWITLFLKAFLLLAKQSFRKRENINALPNYYCRNEKILTFVVPKFRVLKT